MPSSPLGSVSAVFTMSTADASDATSFTSLPPPYTATGTRNECTPSTPEYVSCGRTCSDGNVVIGTLASCVAVLDGAGGVPRAAGSPEDAEQPTTRRADRRITRIALSPYATHVPRAIAEKAE